MVGDMQVHPAIPGDLQTLFYCFKQLVAFVTHVGGVQGIERGRHFCQFGNLIGITVPAGAVDQTAGETAGTLLQRPGYMGLHFAHLHIVGRLLAFAHDQGTHGIVPHKHHVIDSGIPR